MTMLREDFCVVQLNISETRFNVINYKRNQIYCQLLKKHYDHY